MSGCIENAENLFAENYERVLFVDGEAKTYETKVILAYLDSPFLTYTRNTRFNIENPIPVRNDDGKEIGFADVFVRNNKLVADLRLDYATPERLAAETKTGLQFFPHVKGTLTVEDEPEWSLDLYGKKKRVKAFEIYYIKLLPFPTEDARLDSLGMPVLL